MNVLMKFKFHPFGSLGNYKFADIAAKHDGKWIFCQHKERTTWEIAGGHIEPGETPLEAAKRELFEETGTTHFDIEPLCDYFVEGYLRGVHIVAHGQVFYAQVHALGELPPESEMARVRLFDECPSPSEVELTYPGHTCEIFKMVASRG